MRSTYVPLLLSLLAACKQPVVIGEWEPPDLDGDGTPAGEDCDDLDELREPGRTETCDGIDNDCDGLIDAIAPNPANPVAPVNVCERTVTFDQTLRLDLLFVIDNSNTMLEAQEQLVLGTADLLPYVLQPAYDTHVGVVTTDMEDRSSSGKLLEVQGYRWADWSLEIPLEEWAAVALAPGIDGSGDERPLDAIIAALDGRNPGFRRSDAHLAVVVLSDEEDDSELTPQAFMDLFDSHDGGSGAVVHGLINQGEACRQTVPAERLDTVIGATGGLQESICSTDFGSFLAPVGQESARRGLESVFPLDEPAQLGSVRVHVQYNGQRLNYDDFTLSPWGDAVIMSDPPPQAGSRITIRWLAEPRSPE